MKTLVKKHLFAFMLSAFCSFSFYAQNKVSGTVKEASGHPLPGASVIISGTSEGTTSDFDGDFTLSSEVEFPWTLLVSYTGFKNQEIVVSDGSQIVNLILAEDTAFLDEVIVTASRKAEKANESPASISVLSSKKLAAVADGGNVANLVKNLAGVSVQEHGIDRSVIELRGANQVLGGRTQIYKDNRPLNEFGNGNFESQGTVISPIDIKRVEVMRGPAGALYGPGVDAGVVHYITKDPWDESGTTISLSAGNQSLWKTDARHAGIINEKFGYKFLAGGMRADDWQIDEAFQPLWNGSTTLVGGGVYEGETIEHGGNLIKEIGNQYFEGAFYYKPKANIMLTATYDWAGFKGNRRNTQGDFYIKDAKNNIQLKAQISNLFVAYNINWLAVGDDIDGYGYTGTYSTSSILPNGDIKDSKFETQYAHTFGPVDLVGGFDYIQFKPKDNTRVAGRFANTSFKTIGGYLQAKYNVSEKFFINGVARVDRFDAYDRTELSPRLAAVYKPNSTSQIRASYNRSYANMVPVRYFLDFTIAPLPFGAQIQAIGGVEGVQFTDPKAFGLPFAPGVNGASIQDDQLPISGLISSGALAGALNGAIGADAFAALQAQAVNANTSLEYLLFRDNISIPTLNGHGIGGSDLITTNTFEVGYKGVINEKLIVSLDVYNNTIENFESPAIPLTPFFQAPNLKNDLQTLATAAGLTPDEIAAIGTAVDNSPLGNSSNIGIVESDQSQSRLDGNPQVNFGFTNFGKASYWGSDFSLEYYITPEFSAFGNYSWISTNIFSLEDLGEPADSPFAPQYLNTPKNKYRLGVNYLQSSGLTGSIAFSHNDSYEANSGIFNGMVESRDLVDLTVGYKLKNGLKLTLSVSNLFDNKFSYFPRMPKIGRVGILNLQYHFGGKE